MKRREFSLAGLASLVSGLAQAQSRELGVPIDLPSIALLDRGKIDAASWHGQPAIVVFWATYCPYCKRHSAHIDKLYRAAQSQALRVLGLALEFHRRRVAFHQHVDALGMRHHGGLCRRMAAPLSVISERGRPRAS